MGKLEQLEILVCDNALPIREQGRAGNGLTGTGVEYLRSLSKLNMLNFSGSPITNDGALAISQLGRLRILKLSLANRITDAGVASLATMSDLEELQLTSRRITDAALESLGTMPRLKTLIIHGEQLSDSGLQKLQERLPETRINANTP
jgi:Leucine-rich repeat (LRR) protein